MSYSSIPQEVHDCKQPAWLQQSHLATESIAQPDLMGVVADASVQCFIVCTELIAVTQPEATEVKLCHACQLAVASHVDPDTEYPLDEKHRRGLRLRTQTLCVGHQHRWSELEIRA